MTTRIFCLLNNVTRNTNHILLDLEYQGESIEPLLKALQKQTIDKKNKLIEISAYPDDRWKLAFRFWHKCIDLICNELALKKLTVIMETIPLTRLNLKEYIKAEFGRHKLLYKQGGTVVIQNASSTTYSFDELMNIINNTLQFARDNQVDIDTFLDEYKELTKGEII